MRGEAEPRPHPGRAAGYRQRQHARTAQAHGRIVKFFRGDAGPAGRRFNGFVKSVILRISEARDTGSEGERLNRFALYDHLKIYAAAPPDVPRCDEKNLREYNVTNCLGLVLTSNYRKSSIYLPPDDRRFFVAWSNAQRSEFADDYWIKLWNWYENEGGFGHVAAYLRDYDLTEFNAKAEPPRTPAFWAIVEQLPREEGPRGGRTGSRRRSTS